MAQRMTPGKKYRKKIMDDEPTQSDATLLLKVEDLINMAMGPAKHNVVNFKLIQTILFILARQLRMLEQQVEIRVAELRGQYLEEEQGSDEDQGVGVAPLDKKEADRKGKAGKDKEKKRGGGRDYDDSPESRQGSPDKAKKEKSGKDKEGTGGGSGGGTGRGGGATSGSEGDDSKREKSKDRAKSKDRDGATYGSEGDESKREKSKDRAKSIDRDDGASDRGGSPAKKEQDSKKGGEGGKTKEGKEGGGKGGESKGKKGGKGESGGEKEGESEGGRGGKGGRGGSAGKEGGGTGREAEDERSEKTGKRGKASKKGDDGRYGEDDKGGESGMDREIRRGRDDEETTEAGSRKSGGVASGQRGKGAKKGRPGGGGVESDESAAEDGGVAGVQSKAKSAGTVGSRTGAVQKPGAGGVLQPTRVGSVEVVTQKQFAVLESAVRALENKASLPPPASLPDNQKLRDDIAKGNASLTDTMQAMQLAARVQAAEKAVGTMADMLTQLAAAGVLPQDVAGKASAIQQNIDIIRKDMTGGKGGKAAPAKILSTTSGSAPGPRKSVNIDAIYGQGPTGGVTATGVPSAVSSAVSQGQRSVKSAGTMGLGRLSMIGVTRPDLDEAVQQLRDELMKVLASMTQRATTTADSAAATIKALAEKMEIALKLDSRLTFLTSLVSDYADQLSGFDTGLSSQMTGFQEQMAQMRAELTAGLTQLEQVNNNAETAAVLELTERYEGLLSELDSTVHAHQGLTAYQRQLSDELKSLVECVEMMREQKADRDEVLDGLRDKADNSRLAGLVSEDEFQLARDELDVRMQMCYDKFRKQDAVWMNVMNDFNHMMESKAELMQLLGAREEAQDQLRDLHWRVQQLQRLLGDPKAAVLIRKLAKDATCGVCREPALMEPVEPTQPISLPEARPPPAGAPSVGTEDPCYRNFDLGPRSMGDSREVQPHLCLRWVGGSHTLTAARPGQGNVARERAGQSLAYEPPVKRYMGYGIDGKLYNLEEELQPCVECNQYAPEKVGDGEKIPGEADMPRGNKGGGDQPAEDTRQVTVVDDGAAHVKLVVESVMSLEGPEESGELNDKDVFPSLAQRASALSRTSTIAMLGIQSRRPTEVGSTVKGRVTVVDEEAAERAAMLHELAQNQAATSKEAGTEDA